MSLRLFGIPLGLALLGALLIRVSLSWLSYCEITQTDAGLPGECAIGWRHVAGNVTLPVGAAILFVVAPLAFLIAPHVGNFHSGEGSSG